MSDDGWCDRHRDRLHAAKDARAAAETLIVRRVMETGRAPIGGCWACPLSELEFQDAVHEGTTMISKAEAYGGTYTTPDVSISIGPVKTDPS